MESGKKIIITIAITVLVIGGVIAGLLFLSSSDSQEPTNTSGTINTTNATTNATSNSNDNTNQASLDTNKVTTIKGKVFIKGYGTPSESYGVLSTEGFEIGLGSYDSMREQVRPYTGETISATFSNICKSSNNNCCKTLFYYCGTVESFTPPTNSNI